MPLPPLAPARRSAGQLAEDGVSAAIPLRLREGPVLLSRLRLRRRSGSCLLGARGRLAPPQAAATGRRSTSIGGSSAAGSRMMGWRHRRRASRAPGAVSPRASSSPTTRASPTSSPSAPSSRRGRSPPASARSAGSRSSAGSTACRATSSSTASTRAARTTPSRPRPRRCARSGSRSGSCPRGTATPDRELLPFKSGAFRLAIAAGVPILPIVCGPLSAILDTPHRAPGAGRSAVRVLEPVADGGARRSRDSAGALIARVRARMQATLDGAASAERPAWSEDRTLELSGAALARLIDAAARRILAHIESLPRQPAADTEGGAELARSLEEPLPETGRPVRGAARPALRRASSRRASTPPGPGYLAYIPGGGLPHAAVADLIADATNRYVGVFAAAPGLVADRGERRALVLRDGRLSRGPRRAAS